MPGALSRSQLLDVLRLSSFRDRIYPLVLKDGIESAEETQSKWLRLDSADPERHNAPATDLDIEPTAAEH